MVKERMNAVMITEEDLEQLFIEWNNVPGWIKAHVSAKCPAHRYEGDLLLDNGKLVFEGHDIKEGKYFELEIPLENMTDVGIGFSPFLQKSIDPTFGIGGTEPFVVRYRNNGMSHTLYINTCPDRYLPHANICNRKWYEMLDGITTKNKRFGLVELKERVLATV